MRPARTCCANAPPAAAGGASGSFVVAQRIAGGRPVARQVVELSLVAEPVGVVVVVRLAVERGHVDAAGLLHVAHVIDQVLRRIVHDSAVAIVLGAVERAGALAFAAQRVLGDGMGLPLLVVLFGVVQLGRLIVVGSFRALPGSVGHRGISFAVTTLRSAAAFPASDGLPAATADRARRWPRAPARTGNRTGG